MNNQKSDESNKQKFFGFDSFSVWILKYYKYILIIGLILLFISPFLFTRMLFLPGFDFTDTGQIGDTIGGITAPIVNLIGAVLIYISFLVQVKANKDQQNSLLDEIKRSESLKDFNTIIGLLTEIKDDYNSLFYVYDNGSSEYGKRALYIMKSQLEHLENTNQRPLPKDSEIEIFIKRGIFSDLRYISEQISLIADRINISEISSGDKALLKSKLILYYKNKLSVYVDSILSYKNNRTGLRLPKTIDALEKCKKHFEND